MVIGTCLDEKATAFRLDKPSGRLGVGAVSGVVSVEREELGQGLAGVPRAQCFLLEDTRKYSLSLRIFKVPKFTRSLLKRNQVLSLSLCAGWLPGEVLKPPGEVSWLPAVACGRDWLHHPWIGFLLFLVSLLHSPVQVPGSPPINPWHFALVSLPEGPSQARVTWSCNEH